MRRSKRSDSIKLEMQELERNSQPELFTAQRPRRLMPKCPKSAAFPRDFFHHHLDDQDIRCNPFRLSMQFNPKENKLRRAQSGKESTRRDSRLGQARPSNLWLMIGNSNFDENDSMMANPVDHFPIPMMTTQGQWRKLRPWRPHSMRAINSDNSDHPIQAFNVLKDLSNQRQHSFQLTEGNQLVTFRYETKGDETTNYTEKQSVTEPNINSAKKPVEERVIENEKIDLKKTPCFRQREMIIRVLRARNTRNLSNQIIQEDSNAKGTRKSKQLYLSNIAPKIQPKPRVSTRQAGFQIEIGPQKLRRVINQPNLLSFANKTPKGPKKRMI